MTVHRAIKARTSAIHPSSGKGKARGSAVEVLNLRLGVTLHASPEPERSAGTILHLHMPISV